MRSNATLSSIAILTLAIGCQQAAPGASENTAAQTAQQSQTETARPAADLLPNQKQPAEGVISGGQPTPEQLEQARDAGYKTVVNIRLPQERGVDNEPELVASLGMDYISVPIDGAAGLTRENVELFAQTLESVEQPILLHCGSGNRPAVRKILEAETS